MNTSVAPGNKTEDFSRHNGASSRLQLRCSRLRNSWRVPSARSQRGLQAIRTAQLDYPSVVQVQARAINEKIKSGLNPKFQQGRELSHGTRRGAWAGRGRALRGFSSFLRLTAPCCLVVSGLRYTKNTIKMPNLGRVSKISRLRRAKA